MNNETQKLDLISTTCSALQDDKCKHGHAVLGNACRAPYLGGTYSVKPSCMSEHWRFNEEKQVVTGMPYRGRS